jgi:hypothetical protein
MHLQLEAIETVFKVSNDFYFFFFVLWRILHATLFLKPRLPRDVVAKGYESDSGDIFCTSATRMSEMFRYSSS